VCVSVCVCVCVSECECVSVCVCECVCYKPWLLLMPCFFIKPRTFDPSSVAVKSSPNCVTIRMCQCRSVFLVIVAI